jgi:hypothetical protein
MGFHVEGAGSPRTFSADASLESQVSLITTRTRSLLSTNWCCVVETLQNNNS